MAYAPPARICHLKSHQAHQPDLPNWRETALKIGGHLYPLCQISSADMDAMLAEEQAKGEFVAIPVYISHDEHGRRVYPRPAVDYEAVEI